MRRAITLALFATILLPLCARAQKTPGAIQPNWTPPTAAGVGWESGTYKYDGSGNIVAIGQDLFGYDGANRLTGSTVAAHGVATSQTFRYDRNGNLLDVDTSVMPAGLQQPLRTFNAAMTVDSQTNRALHTCENLDVSLPPQCQTWSYDEAGKQTGLGTAVHYRWDAVGSMSELTADPVHEQYVYDANDERVVMVTLGRTSAGVEQEVTRRWTWRDAENKVAREAVEHVGTAVWSDARDYVYRDGMLLASFESPNASIAERHYHVDHLGTPRLITNAQRGALAIEGYLPFGGRAPGRETARIDFRERMQFTGHERDGDDSPYRPALDYMHARYYTPQWGRFLSVDPAPAKRERPQSWNRYQYSSNNPVNRLDASGKKDRGVILGVADALIDYYFEAPATNFFGIIYGATHDDVGLMAKAAANHGLEVASRFGGLVGLAADWAPRFELQAREDGARELFQRAMEVARTADASSNGKPIVLWSGKAEVPAMKLAGSIGGMTIRDTEVGRRLHDMNLSKSLGYQYTRAIWLTASIRFVGNSTGAVHVFPESAVAGTLQADIEINLVEPSRLVYHDY